MGNWLSELVRTNRLKSLEVESNRPAPWEGRTRAELIYGRERNDEEPFWPSREPAVMWHSHDDGTHTVRLRDSSPGGQETSSGQTGSVPDAPQGGAASPIAGAVVPSTETTSPAQPNFLNDSIGGTGTPAISEIISVTPQQHPISNSEVSEQQASNFDSLGNRTAIIFPDNFRNVVRVPGDQDAGSITMVNDNKTQPSPDYPVDPRLAGTIENYVYQNGSTVNINSTFGGHESNRKSTHKTGHGLDINTIDGEKVAPGNSKAANMVEYMKNQPHVLQVFGPDGAYKKINGQWISVPELKKGHQNHIHIGTRLP